eukprot:TRINITY_DN11655_c0_g1_i1.p1 TRINITY_DN11655_c0_g1~~TRINITY_DN11655_c0_g1_i1.p1  ORF type:complete len:516 (+),score=172.32 TRINITY_DN11655_c0_g1_i1:205-1548(+)
MDALLATLDDVLLHFLVQLQDMLRDLRTVCGLDKPAGAPASAPLPTAGPPGALPGNAAASAKGEGGRGGGGGYGDRMSDANFYDDDDDLLGGERGDGGAAGGEEEEWALVQGALELLAVSESLAGRSAVFEASLRAALARLATTLLPAVMQISGVEGPAALEGGGLVSTDSGKNWRMGSPSALRKLGSSLLGGPGAAPAALAASWDSAVLRLAEAPEKMQRLSSLLEQTRDPRFHCLPRTALRIATFRDAVAALVYDVLLSKVRRSLAGVAQKPVWAAEAEENVFDLPSFSALPEGYITTVGEYLLQLPQQLEPLSEASSSAFPSSGNYGEETGDEDPQGSGMLLFATEWLFKVAEGAAALYIEQLRAIPKLSERGTSQLVADVEYLTNVLSALSVASPPALATFQLCLSVPREGLKELIAQEAGPGGALDPPTARAVAKMRDVALD